MSTVFPLALKSPAATRFPPAIWMKTSAFVIVSKPAIVY
jgi:hypothetical protein